MSQFTHPPAHVTNPPMPTAYWLFVLLTLLLTAFLAYTTFRSARLLAHWPPTLNPLLLPGENVIRLLLIAVCFGLGRLSGLPPAQLGWRFEDVPLHTLWGVAAGLVIAGLYITLTRLVIAHTGPRFYRTTILRLILPRTHRQLVAVLLAMGPVVLVEELVFRSLLVGGLSPIAPVAGLVLAGGILFGALHSPQGVWGVVATTVAGVGLGWALVATGSIVLPVTAHYVANAAQIVVAFRLGMHNYA